MTSSKHSPREPTTTRSDVLRQVEAHLAAGDARQALALLDYRTTDDPYLANARGVCLLRTGSIRMAIELFRSLALRSGSLYLDRERPTVFITNFATALLLDDNIRGCLGVLDDLAQDTHPSVVRLRAAIASWQGHLGWRARLRYWAYGVVERPVQLDGPAGELLLPEQDAPRRAA